MDKDEYITYAIILICTACAVTAMAYSLGRLEAKPKLCPAPYDTLLLADGVICRYPQPPKTEYYIQDREGLISFQCAAKPQIIYTQTMEP